jgi:hypothetical protein
MRTLTDSEMKELIRRVTAVAGKCLPLSLAA